MHHTKKETNDRAKTAGLAPAPRATPGRRKRRRTLLFAAGLSAAGVFLTPALASAFWIDWDVIYPVNPGAPGGVGVNVVLYGPPCSTVDAGPCYVINPEQFGIGGYYFPDGLSGPALSGPTFSGVNIGPALPMFGGSANTDIEWTNATPAVMPGGGAHIGGSVFAHNPQGINTVNVDKVYFSDNLNNPIYGSWVRVITPSISYTYTVGSPSAGGQIPALSAAAPSAPPSLPSTIGYGETVTTTLPAVPAGSQLVFYQVLTDPSSGQFVSSVLFQDDPPSGGGGAASAIVSLTNSGGPLDGGPGSTLSVAAAYYAMVDAAIDGDLSPGNTALMQQLSQTPITIIVPENPDGGTTDAPALPPWAFAFLACTLAGTAVVVIRRRRSTAV